MYSIRIPGSYSFLFVYQVERRNDRENALELRLKFWEYKKDIKR